jgi:hypothetical protein
MGELSGREGVGVDSHQHALAIEEGLGGESGRRIVDDSPELDVEEDRVLKGGSVAVDDEHAACRGLEGRVVLDGEGDTEMR